MEDKIRIAIAGVGNCASSLVQGIHYYRGKMESEVIAKADAIVFVSEALRQLVMREYPQAWQSKAFVLPHCYDPELASSFKGRQEKLQNPKFTLTYTGSVYSSDNLAPLFQAIRHILDKHPDIYRSLVIQFVGKIGNKQKKFIQRAGIDKLVSLIGFVPYLKSLEYMAKADVLLSITPAAQGHSTRYSAKIAEYFGFKKPILAITHSDSSFAPLIGKIKAGIVASPDDADDIEQAIMTLYQDYQQGILSKYTYSDGDIEVYNAINMVKRLAQLFNRTIARDSQSE